MNILIGGAWPYANGSLHLGHISSLLSGDILARYYRAKGNHVLYVSGSDCNGTPIAIRAKQEGVVPKQIADTYHKEFKQCFDQLGFTYDCYTRTDAQHHHTTVGEIFTTLMEKGNIYRKEVEQAYCSTCEQFLPDRFVEGICPHCGKEARGDQCEHCSKILEPLELVKKKCKLCGSSPVPRNTEHFYYKLSTFQQLLEHYLKDVKEKGTWRDNALKIAERYIQEGLHDRAISRDLPVGVPVPVAGYEDKKIYVWFEAVAGYYTASKKWAEDNQKDHTPFWEEGTISYYIHGKDNVPFHAIIWPGILLGLNKPSLPTYMVSNEYVTIEKKKLSTSKNWAVWAPRMLEKYDPDSIRYFLTINAPEHRDADFSWREFIYSHNSELLGAYGNFVNRTVKFIEKFFHGVVPEGQINEEMKRQVDELYQQVGTMIEHTHFKQALELIFEFIRGANKYFDQQKPWIQVKASPKDCQNTLRSCVYIIVNLAQLLHPFLPFSSDKLKQAFNIEKIQWRAIDINNSSSINISEPLFERIDVTVIDEEIEQLRKQSSL